MHDSWELEQHLADHYGVVSRREAAEMGVSSPRIAFLIRSGRWQVAYRGVYARRVPPLSAAGRLRAACLAVGPAGAASHASAAAMWGLLSRLPWRPTVTALHARRARVPGIDLRRRDDLDLGRVIVHLAIPVTDPLRTLADLGEVVTASQLDEAMDRALATQLVTVEGLWAEVARLGRRGRAGVPSLRAGLERRGMLDAPRSTVLESRMLRLLHRWKVRPEGAQVQFCGGRYRVDVLVRPMLVLEVDGYAYHSSPEAKAYDSRRRNALRAEGVIVVEADWVTVVRHPEQVCADLAAAFEAWRRQYPDLAATCAPWMPNLGHFASRMDRK